MAERKNYKASAYKKNTEKNMGKKTVRKMVKAADRATNL